MVRPLLAKKILVASLGVATVSYVGCADSGSSSDGSDGGSAAQGPDGNLMATPDATDDFVQVVGNLMATPPPDATDSADAPGDATDAPFDAIFGADGNLTAPPDAADAPGDAPEGG
jgi:hypothetical protein